MNVKIPNWSPHGQMLRENLGSLKNQNLCIKNMFIVYSLPTMHKYKYNPNWLESFMYCMQ